MKDFDFNIQATLVHDLIAKIHKQREDQIIERLKDFAYYFDNRQQLLEFAKTRLKLITYEEKPHYKELRLDDGKLIAHWDDTPNFEFKDGKYTITVG